jgi:hypothetical protein
MKNSHVFTVYKWHTCSQIQWCQDYCRIYSWKQYKMNKNASYLRKQLLQHIQDATVTENADDLDADRIPHLALSTGTPAAGRRMDERRKRPTGRSRARRRRLNDEAWARFWPQATRRAWEEVSGGHSSRRRSCMRRMGDRRCRILRRQWLLDWDTLDRFQPSRAERGKEGGQRSWRRAGRTWAATPDAGRRPEMTGTAPKPRPRARKYPFECGCDILNSCAASIEDITTLRTLGKQYSTSEIGIQFKVLDYDLDKKRSDGMGAQTRSI